MPYYCRSRVSQALNHGAGKSLSGSRILVLGVAYKADISDMRESPAVKLIELLQNAGRGRLLPRSARRLLLRARRRALLAAPRAWRHDAVVIATAHSSIDYERARRRCAPRRRPPERARPPRHRRGEGLEAVIRVAHAGVGGWGKNVARVVGELTELAWIVDTDEARQAEYAPRYPQARGFRLVRRGARRRHASRRSRSRRPVPTHYALAKEALEAGKHVFVEKPPAMRGEEMEELVELARANGARADAGAPAPLPPGPAEGEGARRLRRARRCGLRLRQPAEPRRDPVERERALVARRPRSLGDPLAPRRRAVGGGRATGRTSSSPGSRTSSSASCRFPSGKVAHMHLSWLDPHKMRKMTVVGREKMVVFDDMELERKVTVYEKGPWEPTHGGVAHANRRHLQSRRSRTMSPSPRVRALPAARRRGTGDHREATDGLAVVRALDRLRCRCRTESA